MDKLIEFTLPSKGKVSLVLAKIVGFSPVLTEPTRKAGYKTFIATGPDNGDGENGWYVAEEYELVRNMMQTALSD